MRALSLSTVIVTCLQAFFAFMVTQSCLCRTQHFSQGGGGHFRDVSQTVIVPFKYYSSVLCEWKDLQLQPWQLRESCCETEDISMMNLSSLSWRCSLCFVEQQEWVGGREAGRLTLCFIPEALMIQPARITERQQREQFPGLNQRRRTCKAFQGFMLFVVQSSSSLTGFPHNQQVWGE